MPDTIAHREKDWNQIVVAFAWLAVGLPLLWGVLNTLIKAVALFR